MFVVRYANHRRVFLEHYGPPPWVCDYCGELIAQLGKRSRDGAIHHRDEDKLNNDPRNLAIMHFGCHRRHHMMGTTQSVETRRKIAQSNLGHSVSSHTRAQVAKANRGNTYCVGRQASPETRRKLANMGKLKTCECGLVTSPGSMAGHVRASGHRVIDELP